MRMRGLPLLGLGISLIAAAPVQAGEFVGKPFPDLKFEDMDGFKRSIKDFRGEVVFIEFWATW